MSKGPILQGDIEMPLRCVHKTEEQKIVEAPQIQKKMKPKKTTKKKGLNNLQVWNFFKLYIFWYFHFNRNPLSKVSHGGGGGGSWTNWKSTWLTWCDQIPASDMGIMLEGDKRYSWHVPLLPTSTLIHLKVCPFRTGIRIHKSTKQLLLCFSDADS